MLEHDWKEAEQQDEADESQKIIFSKVFLFCFIAEINQRGKGQQNNNNPLKDDIIPQQKRFMI